MTCVVVCIRKGIDPDEFAQGMRAAGIEFESVEGLRRHFIVHRHTTGSFPLRDHPAVDSVIDGGAKAKPPLAQGIELDYLLRDGSWAIARIIRRAAPWNVDHLKHPIRTYYRAERDGAGVDLYVVDSGIEVAHPELSGRAQNVYGTVPATGDDNGHGTLCASAAAGSTVGVARGAQVFGFKSSVDSGGGSTTASVVLALGQVLLHYNARNNTGRPAVVNMSISPTLDARAAVSDLIDAGMVVVLSAGNEMAELTVGRFPLAFAPDLIVVGGSNMADLPYWVGSDGTNYGGRVDILAPGLALRAAAASVRGVGPYEVRRGTSVSAPYVSGVVACMLQGHARLTSRTQVQAVRAKLLANATSGRMRSDFGMGPLPDRLVYLDPDQSPGEEILGL